MNHFWRAITEVLSEIKMTLKDFFPNYLCKYGFIFQTAWPVQMQLSLIFIFTQTFFSIFVKVFICYQDFMYSYIYKLLSVDFYI